MNWDAIGAVGEIIGAIAVVISLIYVGVQIRQNTVVTKRSNARQTASDHERALTNFLEEDVAELILRGLNDIGALSHVEQYRFDLAVSIWLESIEQAYADAAIGSFPQEQLVSYRNRLFIMLSSPGGREWWSRRKVWFSEEFRAEIERLEKQGAPKDMAETGLIT
jgi:hypothetical protein